MGGRLRSFKRNKNIVEHYKKTAKYFAPLTNVKLDVKKFLMSTSLLVNIIKN